MLATNIEYGACDKTWEYYCEKAGAKYIRQHIHLPLVSAENFINDLWQGVTAHTKLIFISHITSTTALILPVKEIALKAKAAGIPVFIDGAHAPGHIPLDLTDLQPDYYTGACHKWMMTPKGSSFFYAAKDKQATLDPLIISWGYRSKFPSGNLFYDWHQMNGTRDYTAYLCIPESIKFMQENNWKQVAAECHHLAMEYAPVLCHTVNATPTSLTNDFYGQMFSAKINCTNPEKLHDLMYEKYNIQIPVMRQDDDVYIRYSIQAFNTENDLNKLITALEEIKMSNELIL